MRDGSLAKQSPAPGVEGQRGGYAMPEPARCGKTRGRLTDTEPAGNGKVGSSLVNTADRKKFLLRKTVAPV